MSEVIRDKIALSAQIHRSVMVGENVEIGENVVIQAGCVIGNNVVIGSGTYIDLNVIIRDNVRIGADSFVGARAILGEYLVDFVSRRENAPHMLVIGDHAVIRSETIIYGDNVIGDNFQTGHRVTLRERSRIGSHVRVGTLSDIQGYCEIGDYVNMHSNVHIGQKSVIKNYVWIFPYVVLTNDPNPPSVELMGVTVEEYAVISTGTVVLPGIVIGREALVGAGAIVTKEVPPERIVVGNPAKDVGSTTKIRHKVTGKQVYPWKYTFDRGMPWEGIGYEQWCSLNGTTEE
jgi:UDP-3-O-[3-hydroxymyristoyl] glucosamine N-acyltransferase